MAVAAGGNGGGGGGNVDPGMLSDIQADIAANSDKINVNMMSISTNGEKVDFVFDKSLETM